MRQLVNGTPDNGASFIDFPSNNLYLYSPVIGSDNVNEYITSIHLHTYQKIGGEYFLLSINALDKQDDPYSNTKEKLEHANYWMGLTSTLLAGRQGFGYALNEFNTLQKTSNTLRLSLNYTKEMSRSTNIVRGLKVGGVFTSGISLAFAYNDWKAGNISNSKFALNAGMTLYTHVPVVGWAAGLQYYLIDTFYPGGIPGFSQDYINQQMEFHNAVEYSMRSFMH